MTRDRKRLLYVGLMTVALSSLTTAAEAKVVSTKKLQIVVVFTDPDLFLYRSNIGGSITSDLAITNPPGSTYIFKGGLFLGDTVDPSQDSYTVDKSGMPLSASNSVGTWVCTGTRLTDWNLSGIDFPEQGTRVEEANFSLLFKSHNGEVNAVYTKGFIVTGVFGVGADFVLGTTHHAVLGGSGLNAYSNGDVKGEIFLSPDGLASLTTLTFSNPIKIEVP